MSDAVAFRRERTIEKRHIDLLGHVNNTVWVHFVVELATAHCESVGMGFERTRELGGIWIVKRHEIDYLLSALEGERVLEETWVESLRGARSLRRARFTRVSDGARLVEARTEWAFVDPTGQRPRRIPRDLQAAFVITGPETPAPPKK